MSDKIINTILGAIVADAAAVGFHWLYDANRLKERALASEIAFHPPTQADFDGVMGFFAHGSRKVGEVSHIGEQLIVLLESIVGKEGNYDTADYIERFNKAFGYGGSYVGYIDTPTRVTLNNLYEQDKAAQQLTAALPYGNERHDRPKGINTARLAITRFGGDAAAGKAFIEETARKGNFPADLLALTLAAHEILVKSPAPLPGADDDQSPAISKLPALLLLGPHLPAATVETAVRVTNNNATAVRFAHGSAALLEAVLSGGNISSAVLAAEKEGLVRESVDAAAAFEGNLTEAAKKFGPSCNLKGVFPITLVSLKNLDATSFKDAVEANILAGGDSCGRAILIGAAYAARHGRGTSKGIPEEWVQKVFAARPGLKDLLDRAAKIAARH